MACPTGAFEVSVGREHYYVHHGLFYRKTPEGFIVCAAPKGAIVRELPPRHVQLHVGDDVYYCFEGVFYQPVRKGFVVVEPPGVRPPPPGGVREYQTVRAGAEEYFFKEGQFFRLTPAGMLWVRAPLGAVTPDLPAEARSVWYQGEEYHECDGVLFQKTPAGHRVVPPPWRTERAAGAR